MRALVVAVAVSTVVAACGSGAPQVAETPTSAREASPAPEVSFETFEGGTATLADFHGPQPLVVNFWASWCPPCVAEMPDFERVHQARSEVTFLGINTQDTEAEADELADQTGVTYPLARDPDGEIARAFGVFGMPSTYFISPDGRVVHDHTGALTRERLDELIVEHLMP